MFLNTIGSCARTKLQLLTFAVSIGVSGIATAHPGDAASSFGVGGSLTVPATGLHPDIGERVIVDSENRVLFSFNTSSGARIGATDASGAVDSSFGTSGDLPLSESICDVKVDSANRLVVVTGAIAKGVYGIKLSRYLSDGSVDSSFGTHGESILFYASGDIYASALAIDSDDNIFVLGEDASSPGETHLLVGKVTLAGVIDTVFGSSGWASIATMPMLMDDTDSQDIAIDHDGNIYLTGYTTFDDVTIVNSLAKITAAGIPDSTFGGGAGFVQLDATPTITSSHFTFAHSIAIDSNNNVVVAGGAGTYSSSQMFVARYMSDGTLDSTFNGSGIDLLNIESSDHAEAGSVLIDGKSRIVLTGVAAVAPGFTPALAVARLNDDATLDTSFGHGGSEMLADPAWKGKGAFTHGENILVYGDYFGGDLMMMDEIIGYDPLVVSPPSGF